MEEKKWETISESERNAMIDECFVYDDVLRQNGHFVGGEALQSAGSLQARESPPTVLSSRHRGHR